jgi:Fe-S-cluster containining protein
MYRRLRDKVDAFFVRVQARHGADMECRSGCHDCCHQRLSVSPVEAEPIRAALAALPSDVRARIADRAARGIDCAALEDGRCLIYADRPLVCRSHGLPIRLDGRVEHCLKNFTANSPDPDCILDQNLLSTTLYAIRPTAERIDLRVIFSASPSPSPSAAPR